MLSTNADNIDARTKKILGAFGEGVTEQFGKLNHRVDKIENKQDELKSDVKAMHVLISEVQEEQKRQREVLQLANNRGGITQSDLDSDDFCRPPNLEIVQITSPKYVSLASIENAVKPYMESQKILPEIWSLGGNPEGKRFFMQFAQNAFTSATLAKQVVSNLKTSDGWLELYAETAKPNKEGNFEKVKLFIGPDQTPEQRSSLFMCKKFVAACAIVHSDKEFTFWKQKGVVQVAIEGKKVALAKMLPTSSAVDKTMVRWDNSTVTKLLINKELVLTKFEEQVLDPLEATEWCL